MLNSNEQRENLIKLTKKSKNEIETFLKDFQSDDEVFLALLKFLIDAKKLRATEQEIESQLKDLNFQEDQISLILIFLRSNQNIITSNELRFQDLEWRLETKIASRSSHNFDNIEPKIMMRIELGKEGSTRGDAKELLMETNATNLVHITHKLEQALMDAKSHRNQYST